MSLIDAGFFQTYHRQKEEDFPTTFLDLHIPNGEIDLMDLVGDEAFQEVEAIKAKAEGDRTADEKRMLAAFQAALAELTMAGVVPHLNLVPSDSGFIQSADRQFGDSAFKILSPSQMEKLQNIYKSKAYTLVQRYITETGGIVAKGVFNE